MGVREVEIMIKIMEDLLDEQTGNVDRNSKMMMYIDKLVELMKQEPKRDELIMQLQECKKQLMA